MNKEFGLSKQELHSRFFAMAPKDGEEGHEFVIRVEMSRRSVGASEESTYHSFVPRLEGAMQEEVGHIRRVKRVNGGQPIVWADVVAAAREMTTTLVAKPKVDAAKKVAPAIH